jgi:hypothetical protein
MPLNNGEIFAGFREGSVPHNHTRGSYVASDKIKGRRPSWHALDPGRQAAGGVTYGGRNLLDERRPPRTRLRAARSVVGISL